MEALIDKYTEDVEAKLPLANALSSPASSYLPNGRPREVKMYGRASCKFAVEHIRTCRCPSLLDPRGRERAAA